MNLIDLRAEINWEVSALHLMLTYLNVVSINQSKRVASFLPTHFILEIAILHLESYFGAMDDLNISDLAH